MRIAQFFNKVSGFWKSVFSENSSLQYRKIFVSLIFLLRYTLITRWEYLKVWEGLVPLIKNRR